MRFFIILCIITFQFINANENLFQNKLDKLVNQIELDKTINEKIYVSVSDLSRLQYQNQFIKLNNSVADIDTVNKVLMTKVNSLETYLKIVLGSQEKIYKAQLEKTHGQYESLIKSQELRHKTELDLQVNLFKIIIGLASATFGIIAFVGYRKIKKTIYKRIKKQIESNHKKETELLVMDLANSSSFVDIIKAELDYREMNEEEDEEDDDDLS